MDWLDLLALQGTLKSLQHQSSKASILQCPAFSIVQLSHPYMTIEKTIALTRWTFVGKVMSLLFNMLSRLVITFLPRSKCLLISWLQSPSAITPYIVLNLPFPAQTLCHAVRKPMCRRTEPSLPPTISTNLSAMWKSHLRNISSRSNQAFRWLQNKQTYSAQTHKGFWVRIAYLNSSWMLNPQQLWDFWPSGN